ncbi:serine-arginine repetitive matrix 2/3/4 isoform 9-T9 [Glossina fuscipes fuscipes]
MYNGIGLPTPRGSGTNGHVQRNWAFVRPGKKDNNYRTEEDIKRLDATLNRPPNREILDHDRKRKIEVKCLEFEEILEKQGCIPDEIRAKVDSYRQKLMGQGKVDVPRDEFGRVSIRETHQIAEAQQKKNAKLREAFNISEYFVEGSSFDTDRKAKEDLAKSLALQKELDAQREQAAATSAKAKDSVKRYGIVRTPSKERELPTGGVSGGVGAGAGGSGDDHTTQKKKKKKRTRESSASPERKRDKKKKSKKHKKESKSKKKKSRKRKASVTESEAESDKDSGDGDTSDSDCDVKKNRKKSKKGKLSKGSLVVLKNAIGKRNEIVPHPLIIHLSTHPLGNRMKPKEVLKEPRNYMNRQRKHLMAILSVVGVDQVNDLNTHIVITVIDVMIPHGRVVEVVAIETREMIVKEIIFLDNVSVTNHQADAVKIVAETTTVKTFVALDHVEGPDAMSPPIVLKSARENAQKNVPQLAWRKGNDIHALVHDHLC